MISIRHCGAIRFSKRLQSYVSWLIWWLLRWLILAIDSSRDLFSLTLRLSAGTFRPGTSGPLGARAHPHLLCLLIIKQTQRDEWSPSQQQGVGGTEPTKAVSLRVKLLLYGRAVAPFPSSDCSGFRQELSQEGGEGRRGCQSSVQDTLGCIGQ